MNLIRLRMKPYIQPFERRLAVEELRAVAGAEPKYIAATAERGVAFELKTRRSISELANRLAYWETVTSRAACAITTQALRESSVSIARNGVALEKMEEYFSYEIGEPKLPNRRCLRYGPHGIHEYRGKFFPQLVRSLINVSGARRGGVLADPMSGSGTTVVEGLLAGYRTLGLDINPLSVFVANVKCGLLSARVPQLLRSHRKIQTSLKCRPKRNGKTAKLTYFETLPKPDQAYLTRWFAKPVLRDLDEIVQVINSVDYVEARHLMHASLSNILRTVSWQKVDDLRVRKEIRPASEIDAVSVFLKELESSTRDVVAFLCQSGSVSQNAFTVQEADARHCHKIWKESSIDLIVTSPPYATALPYLDTDRLSLSYLGLLPRPMHRRRDQFMIGNREITESIRRLLWSQFRSRYSDLPNSVGKLITRIDALNSRSDIGFRKRNLPALLTKYFFDMKQVLAGMHYVLKPRSFAFVVVGNNHTTAGKERVEIDTPRLLQDVARSVGFRVDPSMPMEMLISRDIFRKNAGTSEEILAFYKPA